MFSFNFSTNDDNVSSNDSRSMVSWFALVDALTKSKPSTSIIEVTQPLGRKYDATSFFEINGVVYRRLRDIGEHEIDAQSDLIPGVYGGGLKIWECTIDLITYLGNIPEYLLPSKDCHVLELGCGHGFPGIAAMQMGYRNITFLDLNLEVVSDVTWPNIIINNPPPDALCDGIHCYAGDWLSFANFSAERHQLYDFILTSETIYSLETCHQIAYFLSRFLASDGVALVATKKFYFGVGGGSFEFESLCKSLGNMTCEIVRTFQDGQSNIRDIIMVKKLTA